MNNAMAKVLGAGWERSKTPQTPARMTVRDDEYPEGVRVINPNIQANGGRIPRPIYPEDVRITFTAHDQCSVGKSGVKVNKYGLRLMVEEVNDASHRVANDLKLYATDTRMWEVFNIMQECCLSQK